MAAGADISIFLPEPVQHFFGTFLRGNIAGSQIFPVINHIFLLIYHYAAGISLNNIGKRPENFFIIKSNAKNCVTFFSVINLTHSCNLPIVTVYDPLRHHTSVQFAAPPFPVHLIQRNQRIFMAYRNALCKKLYSKNGIVIGFRHSKKWIYYLCILFISGIPIHILILDHFQNLRRISEIIKKTHINLHLAVNILPCLLQDRIHIFHLIFPHKTAHTAVAVQSQNGHRNKAGHNKK